MTKVYIVRHGETEGNAFGRISGFVDTHLTSRGMKQISCLTEKFRDIKIDAVYSSNRDRAIKTAEAAVMGKGLKVNIEPRLGECSLGVWDDMLFGDVQYHQSKKYYEYFNDYLHWHVRFSEHCEDLRARMIGVVRDLAEKHDGESIVLVSHGHAIRALICELTGVPLDRMNSVGYGGNTAVSLLNVENGIVTPEYLSDMSHVDRSLLRIPAPGTRRVQMYVRPLDFYKFSDYYKQCRKDQYEEFFGSLDGYDEEKTLEKAKKHSEKSPDSVLVCKDFAKAMGIIEFDTRRDAEHGYGWIDFYYVDREYRDTNGFLQPFGEAISYYRMINRTELRMSLPSSQRELINYFVENDMFVVNKDEKETVLGYKLYQ